MKNMVWISFDLGVKGDYEGIYRWLDNHKAKECGDSVACFWYEHSGDLLEDVKKDLRSSVDLDDRKNRVYIIRMENKKMKGSFVFGNRRSAPWVGYSDSMEEADDVS